MTIQASTNLTLTIIGPMYDIQCPICGESICDGEFASSRTDATRGAIQHAQTHGDNVILHMEIRALPAAFISEYDRSHIK